MQQLPSILICWSVVLLVDLTVCYLFYRLANKNENRK